MWSVKPVLSVAKTDCRVHAACVLSWRARAGLLAMTVVMGKHSFPNLVYLGALSLLVLVFTLLLFIAAVTLFLPSNIAFAFGVSTRSFTIAAVILLTAVAVVVFLFARALQRRNSS
jgi:hypothetical protein